MPVILQRFGIAKAVGRSRSDVDQGISPPDNRDPMTLGQVPEALKVLHTGSSIEFLQAEPTGYLDGFHQGRGEETSLMQVFSATLCGTLALPMKTWS